jgi:hypothetical protein
MWSIHSTRSWIQAPDDDASIVCLCASLETWSRGVFTQAHVCHSHLPRTSEQAIAVLPRHISSLSNYDVIDCSVLAKQTMSPQKSSCCHYNHSYHIQSSAWDIPQSSENQLKLSAHQLAHIISESKMPRYTSVITTPQTENTTMPPQRLDAARERISTVCAEHNHFNPNSYLVHQLTRFSSRVGYAYANDRYPLPPDPAQLRGDLRELFERILMLESVAADKAYEDMSVRIWEMANDEHSDFDWEIFKVVIGRGLMELGEQGHWVGISDLETLR